LPGSQSLILVCGGKLDGSGTIKGKSVFCLGDKYKAAVKKDIADPVFIGFLSGGRVRLEEIGNSDACIIAGSNISECRLEVK